MLADSLSTPGSPDMNGALAVYRAWASDNPGKYGYFLNFGKPPMAENPIVLFGFSDKQLFHSHDGAKSGVQPLLDQLPAEQTLGRPVLLAAKVARRIEDNTRHAWGGAVGYVGQGGRASVALIDRSILLDSGQYWLTTGAEITSASDAMTLPEQVRARLTVALRAIASVVQAPADDNTKTP